MKIRSTSRQSIMKLMTFAIVLAASPVVAQDASRVPDTAKDSLHRQGPVKFRMKMGAKSARPGGTGIEGRVVAVGAPAVRIGWTPPPFEHVCTIIITDSMEQAVREVRTDAKGRFTIPLPPGKYFLRVRESMLSKYGAPVEVRKGKMTHADARFDNGVR